ncbi:WD repeat-containing protein 91 [Trichoplax sp. H2]|nr:WD repeat-containing protein 91 [Trichoplax sp. H2]|eukprot:RDD41990.1 WD repeat-containing protein 91 [Trichoplax sp. H2]
MTAAIPVLDEKIKEYFLFRGFTETLKSFEAEIKADKNKSFKIGKIIEQLLYHIKSYDIVGLKEFYAGLDRQFFCRLERNQLPNVRRVENGLLRYYLVNAVQNNKHEKVIEFFQKYSAELLNQSDWKEWFEIVLIFVTILIALPFVKNPEQSPTFSIYFHKSWLESFVLSLHNFLSVICHTMHILYINIKESIQSLPVPSILNFENEMIKFHELEEEYQALQKSYSEMQTALNKQSQEPNSNRIIENKSSQPSHESRKVVELPIITKKSDKLNKKEKRFQLNGSLTKSKNDELGNRDSADGDRRNPVKDVNDSKKTTSAERQSNALKQLQGLTKRRMTPTPKESKSVTESNLTTIAENEESISAQNITTKKPGNEDATKSVQVVPESTDAQSQISHSVSQVLSSSTISPGINFHVPTHSSSQETASSVPPAPPPPPVSKVNRNKQISNNGNRIRDSKNPVIDEDDEEHESSGELKDSNNAGAGNHPFTYLTSYKYLEHHSAIIQCRFSFDAKYVGSLETDGVAKIWNHQPNISTVDTLVSKPPGFVSLEWISNCDKLLLGTGDGTIRIYDSSVRKTVKDIEVDKEYPRVQVLASSPTGTSFVSANQARISFNSVMNNKGQKNHISFSGIDTKSGVLLTWDMTTMMKQESLPLEKSVFINCISYNVSGNLLITGGSDGKCRLYDITNNLRTATWQAHNGTVYAVQFSGDDNSIYSMGADRKFIQWSIRTIGTKIADFNVTQGAFGGFCTPNSQGSMDKKYYTPRGNLFSFDSKGEYVITFASTCGHIYRVKDSEEGNLFKVLTLGTHQLPVMCVDWFTANTSGTGVTGSLDGTIHVTNFLKS